MQPKIDHVDLRRRELDDLLAQAEREQARFMDEHPGLRSLDLDEVIAEAQLRRQALEADARHMEMERPD